MVRLDNLRPYTEYEFSVMLTKGSKSSQYSLSIRNTTQEDGRFDIMIVSQNNTVTCVPKSVIRYVTASSYDILTGKKNENSSSLICNVGNKL